MAAQLGKERTAAPAEAARESGILCRIHKALDEVFAPRPSDGTLGKRQVRGMNGPSRFLT